MYCRAMANANFKELIGQRFGRLAVLERWANTPSGGARWRCGCDCGRWSVVRSDSLMRGKTTSCGCLAVECAKASGRSKRRHGKSMGGGLYTTWQTMKDRCYNPRSNGWARYGARGIVVCERWRNDFGAFRADVGPKPGPSYSLDREDNDGPYDPGNCRWATPETQGNNRRSSRYIEFRGETLTVTEWSRRLDIAENVLRWRLRSWGTDRSLTEPVRSRSVTSRSRPRAA